MNLNNRNGGKHRMQEDGMAEKHRTQEDGHNVKVLGKFSPRKIKQS
jgi:hypothetical protein